MGTKTFSSRVISTKIITNLCLFILGLHKALSLGENGSFKNLLNMVESHIAASDKYVLPEDNSELVKLDDTNVYDYGAYDFIIVGAGVGGSVVANRLSEIDDFKVLLLEAGGEDNDFSKIYGFSNYLLYSDFNWAYNTTPQKHHCLGMEHRQCYLHHGKVIGGSSTIYGGTYARGHPEDYNRWVDTYKSPGWSYEEVLPYFKKSENAAFVPRAREYHGEGGYISVNYTSTTPGLFPALVEAFYENGIRYTDYNSPDQSGISRPQITLKGNERVNAAEFLKVKRSNLELSLRSFVTKIHVDNQTKEAQGVEFIKNGTAYIANASREVIVCGGGFNSPQLLMLSGIGPKKHLAKKKIPLVKDLPVGKYFQTHANYLGLILRTKRVLYNMTLEKKLQNYVKHLRPLTSATELVGFTNFGKSQTVRPEVEFWFNAPASSGKGQQRYYGFTKEYEKAYSTNTTSDVTIMITVLHPKSRGKITLKSNNPKDKPLIDTNCLAKKEDIEIIYRGVEEILKLNESQSFQKFGAELVALDSPNCREEKLSKKWWICSIKHYTVSANHPVAGNLMGPVEKSSVVNPNLLVHGIKKLRVLDASVIPEVNSGHIMAPTMMVAERGADLIKAKHANQIF